MGYKIADKSAKMFSCNLTTEEISNLQKTKDFPMYDIELYVIKSNLYNLHVIIEDGIIVYRLYQNYKLEDLMSDMYYEEVLVLEAEDKSMNLGTLFSFPFNLLLLFIYKKLEVLGSYYIDNVYMSERIPIGKPEVNLVRCSLEDK